MAAEAAKLSLRLCQIGSHFSSFISDAKPAVLASGNLYCSPQYVPKCGNAAQVVIEGNLRIKERFFNHYETKPYNPNEFKLLLVIPDFKEFPDRQSA